MEENQELNQEQEQQEEHEERKFTQREVDAILNKRLAKLKKDMPSDEERAAFQEYQKKNAPKDDAAKLKDMTDERDSYQTELEMRERENFVLKQLLMAYGEDEDDIDFKVDRAVYRVMKSLKDDENFEDVAKKFLEDRKPRSSVRIDMGGRLNGGGSKKTANDTMNDLLRAARG